MHFTDEYQRELLRKMTNRSWMERIGCLLQSGMFEPELEPVVKEVLSTWRSKRFVPSTSQLGQLCARKGIAVPLRGDAGDNFSFDHDEIMRFAKDRVLREQLAKAHLFVDNGKYDKALAVVTEARIRFPRSGMEEAPDILTTRMSVPKRTKLISTGLPLLDDKLGGGIASEELAAVLAPTSGGKSSFLSFLTAQAVLQGKKVWYATLEVSEADIRGKVQRCLLRTDKIKDVEWVKMGKKLSKTGSRLHVFETPPHTIGADDLDGLIPEDVDLVVIDYADYLRGPSDQPGLSYENLGYIYTVLKGMAMRRKISVWTASQVNRGAYEAEEIYAQHVEASLKKMMICDIAVSINQGRAEQDSDDETGNCVGRLFIAKNRAGPRYVTVDVTINWARTMFMCGRRA
jgi:replicative DNA helicase